MKNTLKRALRAGTIAGSLALGVGNVITYSSLAMDVPAPSFGINYDSFMAQQGDNLAAQSRVPNANQALFIHDFFDKNQSVSKENILDILSQIDQAKSERKIVGQQAAALNKYINSMLNSAVINYDDFMEQKKEELSTKKRLPNAVQIVFLEEFFDKIGGVNENNLKGVMQQIDQAKNDKKIVGEQAIALKRYIEDKLKEPIAAPKAAVTPMVTLSLGDYLANPIMPPEVEAAANAGVANYENNFGLLSAHQHGLSDNMLAGNRVENRYNKGTDYWKAFGSDWIKATFGQTEDQIVAQFQDLPAPQTWTLAEINKDYTPKGGAQATFTLVKGVGANYWHDSPYGKNAIVQVASQFNYLEAPDAQIVPVLSYTSDGTQGPQVSLEAAAAAMYRRATMEKGTLKHALHRILPKAADPYYLDGYLKLGDIKDQTALEALYNHFNNNIDQLEILPQWVKNESSGVEQIQVFTAAPSFQSYAQPAAGSASGKICDLLVSAQYEGIAKLAANKAIAAKPGETINLHLTLVGQGVFKNPPEVMTSAMKKVADALAGYSNVHVYVHGFSDGDQGKIRKALGDSDVTFDEMDRETFLGLK